MAVKILAEKFKPHKCPAVEACPVGALSQKDENTPPVVDSDKCIECGLCANTCEVGEYSLSN